MARSDEPGPAPPDTPRVLNYRTPTASSPSTSTRWISFQAVAAVLLLIVGIQLWLIIGRSDWGRNFQLWSLLVALLVSCIPYVNRVFCAALDHIRHPSNKSALVVACAIAALSTCYLLFTAHYQGRTFAPKWQDEMSYLIQIQLLARGRLWLPHHPLADFFDSFQLIVDPVYAPMYFPGASLLYVPGAWLHVPYWVTSVLASGACAGLVYLIITDLIDGVAGVLGALMLVGLTTFRKMSIMVVGQPAIILFALLMIFCWLRWRRSGGIGWAVALGIFSGWAAITRPLDAVIIALPIGIDMLMGLSKQPARQWIRTGTSIVLGAAPFLILQITFNIGVTGSWHRTPFQYYADRDYPGTSLGFHKLDPNLRPISKLPQKQKFHDEWTIPAIKKHQLENLSTYLIDPMARTTLGETLPHRMMIALLPAALLGLVTRARVMMFLMVPIFFTLYCLYTWFFQHYAMLIAGNMIFLAVLGARQIELAWPFRRAVSTFLTLFIVILTITSTAELNRVVADEFFTTPGLRAIDDKLAALEHKPAVVLFRFSNSNPHEEPVFNTDVAWPDDAEIIRAHDLGEDRNQQIYTYYAQQQPIRAFYRYDRVDGSITFLGIARDLARAN